MGDDVIICINRDLLRGIGIGQDAIDSIKDGARLALSSVHSFGGHGCRPAVDMLDEEPSPRHLLLVGMDDRYDVARSRGALVQQLATATMPTNAPAEVEVRIILEALHEHPNPGAALISAALRTLLPVALVDARTVLGRVADLAYISLAPVPRAAAIATTLREVGGLAGRVPLELEDVRDGFALLSMDRADDTPEVFSRRRTCAALAALISRHGRTSSDLGIPRRLASVLSVVAEAYHGSPDPHSAAMAVTAAREVAELTGTTAGE